METREILKKVKRIEIRTSRIVNSVFSGEYHSSYKGRGMEFDEVRQYSAGDDYRSIDWNVTARMNSPYIKRYREERELTCIILYDASSSNEFGTVSALKGEVAAEVAALISFSAIKNNDKIGLIIFTDQVEKYIPPKKGRDHVLRVIRELLFFRTVNRSTDIRSAVDFLNRIVRRRGNVFLISDMISPDFQGPLKIAAEKHDFTAIKITDPREINLPDVGLIEFEDAETGEHIIIDTHDEAFRKNFRRSGMLEDIELEKFFRRLSVSFINLQSDRNYFDDLVLFFRKKLKSRLKKPVRVPA
ncbi:MAG: hypothetical protein A2096_14385 [Spirochaetes bacterium GWF1_41_5]|nr:MAG: hypothetical protein A2096_14385 [Spirochaetes bacterium GWF1_41_5]HBE04015.1 DUF58 domain-containing protein [Spirochaetia bacterium]